METDVLKILATYAAAPTRENAAKVRAYNFKHPMASMMLDRDSTNLLDNAIRHATTGQMFAG